jgi:hypothetical protein
LKSNSKENIEDSNYWNHGPDGAFQDFQDLLKLILALIPKHYFIPMTYSVIMQIYKNS